MSDSSRQRVLADRKTGIVQVLVGTVFISFSAVFVTLSHVTPTVAGFYRMVFGGAFLIAAVAFKKEKMWTGWKPFLWACLAGILFAADIFCWHRSIHYIGPGLATIMGNFQVFFLAFVGVFVLKEKTSWRFVIAIPLAITGLFLLVGVEWSGLDAQYKTGVGLGIVTAVTYAGFLLVLRQSQREANRLKPMPNLAVICIVTAAILAVVGYVQGNGFAIRDTQTWLSLISYGVLCQALGWIVISWGLTRIETSRVGLLLLLQPTLTFIWDMLFFARPTTAIEILGALLAIGAIHLGNVERRP